MKKQYAYILLLALFVATVGFVVIKYKSKHTAELDKEYQLVPRKGNANEAEWKSAKNNVEKLMAKLKANPADDRSALALANAYIIEGRASGNIAYYDLAAMRTVDKILAQQPNNYEALMLRSLIQLSQHHFAEGLATANAAVDIDANSAFVYGLLVDANVEMGNYKDAVDAADKMVTARPDMRSYSRISYLREIHGDYPGAADAMKLAIESGIPGEESTEWCRNQLARLYEMVGEKEKALHQYQLTLAARPDYPYALSGMARLASANKKYDSAIIYLEHANKLNDDLGIRENLAIAYKNAGQVEKAKVINQQLIADMTASAKLAVEDPTAGHYSDKELAHVYIQNNNLDKALEHALAEYNRRPKNIDVNETMVWVLYKRQEYARALPYLETALSTHSMNPMLLCTAGLVYLKNGQSELAKKILGAALRNNPVLPADIEKESREAFQKI